MSEKSSRAVAAGSAGAFQLPDWPALMRPRTAAAYLDVSIGTFLAQVAPSVPPVHVTTRIKAYMRADLDAWALARRGGEHPNAAAFNPWDELLPQGHIGPAPAQNSDRRPPRHFSTDVWNEEIGMWLRPPPRLYPVSVLERRLLTYLSDGCPGGLPKGISDGTVERLKDRGWIEQVEKHDDSRRNTYVLTKAGLAEARLPDSVNVVPDA